MNILTDIIQPRLSGLPQPRSKGVHLTEIRDWIGRAIHAHGFDPKSGWAEDPLRLAAETGYIWETLFTAGMIQRLCGRELAGHHIEPIGEVMRDGVIGTPDGFDFTAWELHEFKCTWASCDMVIADDPKLKAWKWLYQIKGYMAMMSSRNFFPYDCLTTHIWVLHLNGDYKKVRTPVAKHHVVSASIKELETHWRDMVSGPMGKMRVKGYGGKGIT